MENKVLIFVFVLLCVMTGIALQLKKNNNYAMQPILQAPPSPPVQMAPPPIVPEEKPVVPANSFSEALEQAKTQKKSLFVYFTMNGCGPCVSFKNNLKSADVKKALQNYIVYHVTLEKEPDVFDDYKVRSTPSYFVIDSSGTVVKSGKGNKSSTDFIKWLGNL